MPASPGAPSIPDMNPRCRIPGWALVAHALAALVCLHLSDAHAMVAGAPPDSPGQRVDANSSSSLWRGVASVVRGSDVASGVTVGRRHVLTAGHVVDRLQPASVHTVYFNLGATPTTVPVVRVTVHPDYVGVGNDDLALLELAADVPSPVTAYALERTPFETGTVLTLVGYGDSGTGTSGITVGRSATVKRVGQNVADVLEGNLYYFDFDGPTAATNVLGAGSLGNGIETTVAGGDSGSPAFTLRNGIPTIAGLNVLRGSFAGGPTTPGVFGTAGGGVRIAPYAAWIDATLAASGVESADTDVPLPGWAVAALGLALLGTGIKACRR